MNTEKSFSIEYTNVLKGLAIIMLCFHHIFWREVPVPIGVNNINAEDIVVPVTKTCVSIFLVLSGYGISRSFDRWEGKSINFSIKHIKKILVNYWIIYIPALVLSFFFHSEGTPIEIYGNGITGVISFILDAIGLKALFNTASLNSTWWFVEAIMVFYLAFPLLNKIMKKSLYLPSIVALIVLIETMVINIVLDFNQNDREILYLFTFTVGMVISKKDLFNKLVNIKKDVKYWTITTLSFVTGMITTLFVPIIGNTIFAVAFINLVIGLMSLGRFLIPLKHLGKHSLNIFLMHSFIYFYFSGLQRYVFLYDSRLIGFVILIFSSLIISILIEFLKGKVISLLKSKK